MFVPMETFKDYVERQNAIVENLVRTQQEVILILAEQNEEMEKLISIIESMKEELH